MRLLLLDGDILLTQEDQWEKAARDIATIVTEVVPALSYSKVRHNLYDYFSGDVPGSVFDDTQFYFVEDLRGILERIFDQITPEDEDDIIMNSDIRWAFGQLSVTYQFRIVERYRDGVVYPADAPERAQLNRAIARMCDILNGWNSRGGHDGPGARRTWSNARCRYEIDHNYSG